MWAHRMWKSISKSNLLRTFHELCLGIVVQPVPSVVILQCWGMWCREGQRSCLISYTRNLVSYHSIQSVDMKTQVSYKICKEALLTLASQQLYLINLTLHVPKDEHLNTQASSWNALYCNSDWYMLFYAIKSSAAMLIRFNWALCWCKSARLNSSKVLCTYFLVILGNICSVMLTNTCSEIGIRTTIKS